MLVYRILTDKHSLKKKKKPIFSSQLNTELDENSFHQTLDGTLMCLTLHVLSFTADLTWSFPPSKKNQKKKPCPAQNFLGCWMKKVRVKWGFSTAGRTLLCLTLTGVSGKSWLSCKNTGVCYPHGPRGTVTNPLCSGGVNLTKARMLFFVCLFCFYFKKGCFCLPCRGFLPGEC